MQPKPPKHAYSIALGRLSSLSRFGSRLGLVRIKRLLDALGNPQRSFKCILVAGTNGKGSTTAMLAAILSASGSKTGSYFSPPIFSFRERMQINGRPISRRDFSLLFEEVFSAVKRIENKTDPLTHFEIITAVALLYFSRKKVDYAVLEAGLGGRLDAVNAVSPILSIITSIGLEHTAVLGKTTKAIAREKAGIMRAGVPCVCAVRDKSALAEIKSISRSLHSPLHTVCPLPPSRLPLRASGSFQRLNASAAAAAASLLGIKRSVILSSLSSFTLAGRWQKLSSHPTLIIDCCHNPPAASAIQPDLARDFAPSPASPRVLAFTAMKDKNYHAVLSLLLPHFDAVVLCKLPMARAAKLNELKNAAQKEKRRSASLAVFSISSPDAALSHAKKISGKRGRILVCGSIYLLQFLFGEREFLASG